MPDEIEGAINTDAAVPPTDSEFTNNPQDVEAVDGQEGLADEHVDTQGSEGGEDSEEGEAIPYEQYRETAARAERYEQEARYYQQQAELRHAQSLGFASVEAYESANAWARANNYPNVEAFHAHLEEMNQLQAYAASLERRTDLSAEARQELLSARQQQAAINQQMRALSQQVQFVQNQTLDHAIGQAKAELGPLDPELEALLRGSSPQIVQRATAALKRQMQQAASNRVAEYAARKQRTQTLPSPEGRCGSAPPPAPGPRGSWRKSTFADLIFGTGRTG
ncbi:MAG: hypothetical protein ACLQVD_12850 [Capsulimonadaceae bacterium]